MGGFWGGSLQRRLFIISVFSGSLRETGFLYARCYNGRNLLATGWMVRTDRMGRGCDRGGVEIPMLVGDGTRAPPLALGERHATGSGGCYQLHRYCKGTEYLCQSNKII